MGEELLENFPSETSALHPDEHDDNLVSFMTPSGEAKQYY